MNAQNMSLYAAAAVLGLTTATALLVAAVEILRGESINPLAASFLTSAVVASASALGYHLGNGKNGKGPIA